MSLYLTGSEAKHASSVLRCTEGDVITVVDGCGFEYEVSIERVAMERVAGKILARRKTSTEPTVQVVLAQALCRSSRFDLVVEKATELGVHTILPVVTERSLKMPKKDPPDRRADRWRKITIAAMKQSKRSLLPHIAPPSSLNTVLSSGVIYDICLIASEKEERRGLRDVIADAGPVQKGLVLVGPEGGFSEAELQQAQEYRFHTVSLGPRRLRTETAGPLIVALLLYELGELGGR